MFITRSEDTDTFIFVNSFTFLNETTRQTSLHCQMHVFEGHKTLARRGFINMEEDTSSGQLSIL